jgi:tRNA modification GTPase
LIAAESRSAARAAFANLGGGLANEVRSLRVRLAKVLEELAGAIDFPDEVPDPPRYRLGKELDGIRAVLERLRHDGEAGRVVREGVSVAIVGPPNAGKSSLLNAFLGEERVLVSEIPGTTRDTIEESITIDGVLVRLIDTAGIRAHADRLESAGIERTHRALAAARIALIVLDGSQPLSDEARTLLEETRGRERIVFYNKSDLGDVGARESDAAAEQCVIGTLFDAQTLEALRTAIAHIGWGGTLPDLERPHLAAAREFDAVNEAVKALERAHTTLDKDEAIDLIASDLQRAFTALGHVTGDIATEELLDGIFARFCIGK